MEYNGPYFNDPVATWENFVKDGSGLINSPFRKLLILDGEIIGAMNAYWEDGKLQQWLEVGICLYGSGGWGKGIGTRAIAMWVDEMFETFPHIQRVGFTTWSGNPGMMKIGEKLGFTREATVRKVRFYKDAYYDSVKYGILREEWAARNR
jgi:RimJ/RimL family protein N-acetyltransferase